MYGNHCVLESCNRQMPADDLANTAITHDVNPAAHEPEHELTPSHRTDLLPTEATPHSRQLVDRLDGLWPRRDERRIECADRGADHEIWHDAAFIESAKHSDLQRPEARSARENERGCRATTRGISGSGPKLVLRDERTCGERSCVRERAHDSIFSTIARVMEPQATRLLEP